MRKYLLALLCVCALSVTAFASDVSEYTEEEWKTLYGVSEPRYEDFEDGRDHFAAWNEWYEGFSAFVASTTQAAEKEKSLQETEKTPIETTPTKPIESAGSNNGNSSAGMENHSADKYPLGSYVDTVGVVWSPDGVRLSPVVAPDAVPAEIPGQSVASPTEAALAPARLSAAEASDIKEDEPVWYLADLRSADTPAEIADGLKSLVTSIFGEYTPVTTTTVVTETVGNETRQYLVETVASGAAGVDYEWLASVFLFGILLFCLMKLLGGVLK